jgi:hypothetical protein
MLVSFHKGFIMEGEATFEEKPYFWSKPVIERQKIYCTTGIDGICDDTELEAEVKRLTKERLASSGWGHDFSGWQKVLTYEESLEVAKQRDWGQDYIDKYLPSGKLIVKNLDNWTVAKAAKELTGKQFAQYCKDYGIPCYNNE